MFTIIESGIGAVLIQAATSSYLKLEGKVVGFSSAIYGSLSNPNANNVSIVLGMFLSTKVAECMLPAFASISNPLNLSSPFYALAGLCVGWGTSAGCGCTSGHMLSGLSRLRWRSLVATITFFTTGVITNFLMGNSEQLSCASGACYNVDTTFTIFKANALALGGLTVCALVWSYVILPVVAKRLRSRSLVAMRSMIALSTGLFFGLGLFVAGMTDPGKVTGFLSLFNSTKFDPSLIMIPLFTIIPNILLWQNWMPPKTQRPALEGKFQLNFSNETDLKFIIGNAIFGIGWGIAGICPGPGLLNAFIAGWSSPQALWLASFIVGTFSEKTISKKLH